MRLKFDPSLEYQRDAVDAVVHTFAGQPIAQTDFAVSAQADNALKLSELGVGNNITLSDEEILMNVQHTQEKNDIEKTPALQGRNFSIEMETGTGKTYVYLRSVFELAKLYSLRKFIIVVPSVAIREGVLKSIEMMKGHFLKLYNNVSFNYFAYESKKLSNVRQFANSNQIQIMIINIQSFQKDVADDKDTTEMTDDELRKLNVINRENDKMSGRKPIEFIRATRPIVIIDEPQSVDNTSKARRAIASLNPIATFRYSATHRNLYNLLYKIDPVRAYDLRLVKHIEVDSIRSDDSFNDAYVKLLKTDNKNGIRARVKIHKKKNGYVKPEPAVVKQGDDLYKKSGGRESYRNGYIVQNIDCTPGDEHIEFNDGKLLELGTEIGSFNDDIMKAQVQATVEQHLEKERVLKGKNIKVLSLFFIDRVANYRIYNDDGSTSLGKIGQWFEEAYKELVAKPAHKEFAADDISKIHNGYFSKDKKGRDKDTTTGKTSSDSDAYNLIMRDKERLLDPEEPLRFIFSHSALREGWDNPNVFQICTLNESRSVEKKRQEIGRGLRLPVNMHGDRVHDENVNRLTIVANESYEDFARSLQTEFEEDCGIVFGRIDKNAFAGIMRAKKDDVEGQAEQRSDATPESIRAKKDGAKEPIGREESACVWEAVRIAGYINGAGEILDTFNPKLHILNLRSQKNMMTLKPISLT